MRASRHEVQLAAARPPRPGGAQVPYATVYRFPVPRSDRRADQFAFGVALILVGLGLPSVGLRRGGEALALAGLALLLELAGRWVATWRAACLWPCWGCGARDCVGRR